VKLTEDQIKKEMMPVIATETLQRKWERKLIGSLSKEHSEKCKYHIKLNSEVVK